MCDIVYKCVTADQDLRIYVDDDDVLKGCQSLRPNHPVSLYCVNFGSSDR